MTNRIAMLAVGVLMGVVWPREAPAQSSDTSNGIRGVTANLKFDVSNSSSGALMQFVPEIGYDFTQWGLALGVPIESNAASSEATGAASQRGLGDAYLNMHYVFESERADFSSSVVVTAPTGDSTIGLGAGRATWNWTNHLDHAFAWLSPFVDAGLGNSLNSATSIGLLVPGARGTRARTITLPTQPYLTLGRFAHIDAGLDVSLGRMFQVGVLAYDSIPIGEQTALSRFVPGSKPRVQTTGSRTTRGQRFFELNAITQGSESLTRDNGLGGSISIDPTRYLDVSINYSHSIAMQLDVISVTATAKLTGWTRSSFHRPTDIQ